MPSDFVQRLRALGVARVCYGSYWFCDQTEEELQVFDRDGVPLELPASLWRGLEKLAAERTGRLSWGIGWRTWDLGRDTVVEGGHTEDFSDAGYGLGVLYPDQSLLLDAASATLERGEGFFRDMLHHPEPLVRRALAQNPHLTPALLEPLLCDLDYGVRQRLEQHPHASELAQRRAALERDLAEVRDSFSLPRNLAAHLYSPWWSVRAALANHLSTPSSALAVLCDDPHEAVRLALTTHPSTPPAWVDTTLEPYWNASSAVQERLLTYPTLPAALLEHWAESAGFAGVAHPSVPTAVRLRFMGEVVLSFGVWSGRPRLFDGYAAAQAFRSLKVEHTRRFLRACEAARQPQPLEEQRSLARSDWARVRAELALAPYTAPAVLHGLVGDTHPAVRGAALCNAHTPLELLEEALERADSAELPALLVNPALPWSRLRAFEAEHTRSFLAANPNVPPSTLEAWFEDYSLWHIILRNPAVPLSVQWKVLERAQPHAYTGGWGLEARLTWAEVMNSPVNRQLDLQHDFDLCSLARSSGARPAIQKLIWERFGWPMAEHLLENPQLEPGLVRRIAEDLRAQGRLEALLPLLCAHPHAPEGLPPCARVPRPWWHGYLDETEQQTFERTQAENASEAQATPEIPMEPTLTWLEAVALPPDEEWPVSDFPADDPVPEEVVEGEGTDPLWGEPHWLEHLEAQRAKDLALLEDWAAEVYAQVNWGELLAAARARAERALKHTYSHVLSWHPPSDAELEAALNDPTTSSARLLELCQAFKDEHFERLCAHPACDGPLLTILCGRFTDVNPQDQQAAFLLLGHLRTPPEAVLVLLNASWWDWVNLEVAAVALERPALPSPLRRALEVLLEAHARPHPPTLPGPHRPLEALLGIGDRPDPDLPTDLDLEVLFLLAQMGAWAARAVLRHPATPPELIHHLLEHHETQIVLDALRHPQHTDAELWTWVWVPPSRATEESPVLVEQVLLERLLDRILASRSSEAHGAVDLLDFEAWTLGLQAALEVCAEVTHSSSSRPESLAWVASVRRDIGHSFARIHDARREAVQTWENHATFGPDSGRSAYLLDALLRHPKMPSELLELFAFQSDPWKQHLQAIAENPTLPPTLAQHLAGSHSSAVLCALAQNPATPPDVLEHLALDDSAEVRELAAQALWGREV